MTVDFGRRTGICFIYVDDIARLLGLLIGRLLSADDTLPSVLNFCGEFAERVSMGSHLRQVFRERGIPCAVAVPASGGADFDRRYSERAFVACLPGFARTAFGSGLRLSVDAMALGRRPRTRTPAPSTKPSKSPGAPDPT